MTTGVLDPPMTRHTVPFGVLDRRTILGASEIAPILGMSRFTTPLGIYLAKKRTDAQLIDKEKPGTAGPALWGNRLERSILDGYAIDLLTGYRHLGGPVRLLHGGSEVGTIIHPVHAWRAASPDGIVQDMNGGWLWGVEAKNVDRSQAHRWGDAGSADVPDEYALQCAWSMHVTGLDRWDVVALIGGNDCRVYSLRRDDGLESSIVAAADAFWADHVLADLPPEATAPDNELLTKWMRQASDAVVSDDPEIDGLASQLAVAKSNAASSAEVVDLIEAQLKRAIGDRAGAEGSWGRISWRQNRDGRRTQWEQVARACGADDVVIAAHTVPTTGARVFRFTPAKEG